MEKQYRIGDLVLAVRSSFQRPLYEYAHDFEVEMEKPDAVVEFVPVKSFAQFLENETIVGSNEIFHVILSQGKEYRGFHQEGYLYALTYIEENKGWCYYEDEAFLVEKMCRGVRDLTFCCLERFLLQKEALILHSAYITCQEEGIVFSAPSGTGKSTQAELWERYKQATVVNGDRSIIGVRNGRGYVYGIPMCGTSGITHNVSAPLKAVIVIRRGKPGLRRLDAFEAFKALYSEVSVNYWNRTEVEKTMEVIDRITETIPVYLFTCTKEKESADYLYERLFGGEAE